MILLILILAVVASLPLTAQNPLHIPDTLTGGNINLTLQHGSVQFFSGAATATMGANGNILGPTLILNKGSNVTLNVTNQLGEATTIHWHGLHVAPQNDGGPHTPIAAGTTWSPSFTVLDHAGTYWYHPHLHHKTDEHVSKGIAGLIIVRDNQEAALPLPRRYGIDDIPVVIQTKDFNTGNQIVIPSNSDDVLMVNATLSPYVQVPAQVVRLRLLNGASQRAFNIGLTNNQPFHLIGTDAGLLNAPVQLSRLLLAPGERAEILVNLSGLSGQSIFLRSYAAELPNGIYGATFPGMGQGMTLTGYNPNPLNGANFDILRLDVIAPTSNPITAIPTALAAWTPLPAASANATRTFLFTPETMGPNQLNGRFLINNTLYDMHMMNFTVPLDNVEIWQLTNQSAIAHPFHIHNVPFYILDINNAPPPPELQGRKDVVLVRTGQTIRFITKFTDFSNDTIPYMYHCHLLTHEDDGMMGQFLVTDTWQVQLQAQPTQVCQNGTVVLSAINTGGSGPFTYEWFSRPLGSGAFTPISGVQTSTHTIQVQDSRQFRVVVTNSSQRTKTADVTVQTVVPPTPVISGKRTSCQLAQEQYSTTVQTGDSLRWVAQGGKIIGNATQPQVVVEWESSPAQLTLMYYSTTCGVRTTSATITILTQPELSIQGETNVCPAREYTYSTAQVSGATYRWEVQGGEILSGGQAATVAVRWQTPETTASLTVVRIGQQCTERRTLPLAVFATPNAAFSGAENVCFGDTATYRTTVLQPSNTYSWSVEGGTLLSAAVGDSAVVLWNKTGGVHKVSLRAENTACGAVSENKNIRLAAYPSTTISGKQELCQNDQTVFKASGAVNILSRTWRVQGGELLSSAQADSAIVRAGNDSMLVLILAEVTAGCDTFITRQSVRVLPLPRFTLMGEQQVCVGALARYSIVPVQQQKITWNVQGNGRLIQQNDSMAVVQWNALGSGTISALAENTSGCLFEQQNPVLIAPNPVVTSLTGDTLFVEKGKESTLRIAVEHGFASERRVIWEPQKYVLTHNDTSAVVKPDTTTLFTAQVVDNIHCYVQKDILVVVTPPTTVEEGTLQQEISVAIYPHPIVQESSIHIIFPTEQELCTIAIFDITGRNILTLFQGKAPAELRLPLKREYIATGTYFLQIRTTDGYVTRLLRVQ